MYISKKKSIFDVVENHDDALACHAEEQVYDYLEETWVDECEYDPVADDIRESEHLEDEIEDPEVQALQEEWETLTREFCIAMIPSAKLVLELGQSKLPGLIERSCALARKAIDTLDPTSN